GVAAATAAAHTPGASSNSPRRPRYEIKNVVATFWIVALQINDLRCRPPLNHEISANSGEFMGESCGQARAKSRSQKVATTFLISYRGLLGELELAPDECAVAVAEATPIPTSPKPADVRFPVACSAALPVP